MTVKKNNVQVILSEEDFNIFEEAYDLLSMLTEEGEKANNDGVDINIVDEKGHEFPYDKIESAYYSLGDILWNNTIG